MADLVAMWTDYRERYGLRGKILSLGVVTKRLPDEKRYRLVVIDDSHNLRNREGRRYAAIRDYIQRNGSKCILLLVARSSPGVSRSSPSTPRQMPLSWR